LTAKAPGLEDFSNDKVLLVFVTHLKTRDLTSFADKRALANRMCKTCYSEQHECVARACQVSDTRSVFPRRCVDSNLCSVHRQSRVPCTRLVTHAYGIPCSSSIANCCFGVGMAHVAIRVENFERGAFALPN